METVMSVVIVESEKNSREPLLSCLLDNLKIDEKNIMSSAKKLVEKVLANCVIELLPDLVKAIKGSDAPSSDYKEIFVVVGQGNAGTLMQNEINSPVETQTIGTPKRRKSNEELIGEKIRVWWPDDERFYDGVVDSFDRSTKKHKILYDDGDVEILLLKNEKWEFIEAETKTGGLQENNTSDINASDMAHSVMGKIG